MIGTRIVFIAVFVVLAISFVSINSVFALVSSPTSGISYPSPPANNTSSSPASISDDDALTGTIQNATSGNPSSGAANLSAPIVDLAVANADANTVSILLGKGDGTFGTPTNFAVGTHPSNVNVADFNGDGKLDLVTSNQYSQNISVLLGKGDGTFGAATHYTAGGDSPSQVAIADFNGDGKLDLVTANQGTSTVSIFLGKGDGTFGPATLFAVGRANGVAVADFNGDGKLDLVTADYYSNNVSVLLGDGDGTFGAATNYGLGATNPTTVAIVKLN